MSVSISARPFGLLTDLVDVIKDVAVEDKIAQNNFNSLNENMKNLINEDFQSEKVQKVVQNAVDIISKEYETVFADRELLIKTLEEHGVEGISINGDSLTGKMGGFRIDCYREKPTAFDFKEAIPFTMKITADCSEEEITELINEFNSEYALNTQEENYIKIKERLEEQGLKIEEEEVFEDDVIVLTVNI
ncbi:MAG: hypothetical protein K6A44_03110 [bacterium]|nr:hypothetical protein [bacterium]